MSTSALHMRTGVYAWAREAAAGQWNDLSWVDPEIRVDGRPFMVTTAPDDPDPRFRHVPYGIFLPPAMVTAARQAQEAGEPTALEGVMLIFAKPEWLIASRRLLWTPLTPTPMLLSTLVEAYGVDAALHQHDPARLVRLLAHLPTYFPRRGQMDHVISLLTTALEVPPAIEVHQVADDSEMFACHGVDYWRVRGRCHGALRVEKGIARVGTTHDGPSLAEDVVVSTSPQQDFPHALLRLLPVWSHVRLLSSGES